MTFNAKAVLFIIVGAVIVAGLYYYLAYSRCVEACKGIGLSPELAASTCWRHLFSN
jgi:hypothetical protein